MGKAQQAYAALSPDDAKDYVILKKAILLHYDINEESYQQRFRAASRKEGETNRELSARLQDLADKWTQGCNTKEELKDFIVLEQLVSTLPENVHIWVKERKPKTSTEAGQLAHDYTQARKQNSTVTSGDLTRRQGDQPPRHYQRGGRQGHAPRDGCDTGPDNSNGDVEVRNSGGRRPTQPR